MAQSRGMDRREFAEKALMAMLAGVTVTITGCKSGNPVEATPPPPDRAGVIANNHGHVATITAVQQMAGGNVSISIQGTASHNHVLELSAAEVSTIKSGLQVTKSSLMTNNHMHTITF